MAVSLAGVPINCHTFIMCALMPRVVFTYVHPTPQNVSAQQVFLTCTVVFVLILVGNTEM